MTSGAEIPRGDGSNGHHGEAAAAAPSAAGTMPGGSSYGPLRRRRPSRGAALAKTAALLLIAGSASVAILRSNPSAKGLLTRLSTFQQELPALQESISKTFQDVPRLGRRALEETKGAALSLHTFTAESAELAWEKSEDAFHQLRQHVAAPEQEKNPLERALEGLEGLFRRGENSNNGNSNARKNNLRNKEGRNNNNRQRNMKNREGSNNNNNRRAKTEQAGIDQKKEGGNSNNRRAKADQASSDHSMKQEEGGEQHNSADWVSQVVNSPLATPLLAFCSLIFLLASLVMTPSRRRENEIRNSLILDENEAEIVEFYEKEMECGTLHQTIPFLQDVEAKKGKKEHHNHNHSFVRQSSSCSILMNSERNMSDSSLTRHHRRSSSDPALSRHSSQNGGETRESQCDLYYSRVLETLHYEEEDDDDENDLPVDQGEIDGGGDACDQECQITLLESMSNLTEEDAVQTEEDPEECARAPQSQLAAADDEDTCFESAQSQEARQDRDADRPQSPPSSCSSISSLTSEGYDIEAPFGGPIHEDEAAKRDGGASSSLMPGEEQAPRSPPLFDSDRYLSTTTATPPRSNVQQDRRRSSLLKKEEGTSKGKIMHRRSVSFNPDVEVCEIPRQPRQHHQNELSKESYLYIMLFTVAIAIAVFSLVPAHPSLSPIYSVTREDMLQRAENMLSSQWDVEL